VAEAAIASFLSPDAAERQEAATAKRLDQLDRRMTRLERDLAIVGKRWRCSSFWRSGSPTLPEPAAQAARAKAGERYDRSSRRSGVDSPKGQSCGRRYPRIWERLRSTR
jgi:hypothetical protein